MNMFTVNR